MTTPVESLKDSIRQTVGSIRRDAPAARFIGEQVVKMLGRSFSQKLRHFSHQTTEQHTDIDANSEWQPTDAVSSHENATGNSRPWPQYDVMSARDIISQLRVSPPEVRRVVSMYERGHRARSTILAACDSESDLSTP